MAKKEDLRRCKACNPPWDGAEFLFHRWLIEKDSKGTERAMALIEHVCANESINGRIMRLDFFDIQFID